MQQTALFHDSIYDALAADVMACGGHKKVAAKLWPSQDTSAATQKLRSALNPEQAQKLCAEEIQLIKRMARDAGSFATLTYESQDLGFRFEWISPEDEADSTRREIAEGMKFLKRKFEQLERAEQRPPLKAVR
jgi:hypothetical protein